MWVLVLILAESSGVQITMLNILHETFNLESVIFKELHVSQEA